jgi:sigma-B regulation protein RsbU (phosphoserine phosphatase)
VLKNFAMSHKMQILSIDDDPLMRESFGAFLEDQGFAVLEAENGQIGLELIRSHNPDLVICDLQMPVMNGLEVLVELQKEKRDIPVIVVSGAGVIEDAVKALKLGAWDYLIKPITDMTTLAHAITRALERVQLLADNSTYRQQLEQNAQLQKNLLMLQADQEAGRAVQQQLLPQNNQRFGEYHFVYQWIPSLYLSGDFLDYFKINDHLIGFYLMDVSGHGSSSAFVTIIIKNMISHFLSQQADETADFIHQPHKLLSALNTTLLQSKLGKSATLFYGVIDSRKGELCYAMAGQFPHPIYLHGDKIEILPNKSLPIGIREGVAYQSYQNAFAPGSQLIVLSDGVLELFPSLPDENKEAVIQRVFDKKNRGHLLTKMQEVIEQHDYTLPDDIALLMVARHE